MGVIISHDSELGKELLKWEQHRTKYVPEDALPGNPYVYRPFPKMLYKAKEEQGRVVCIEPPPSPHLYPDVQSYERAVLRNDTLNKEGQRIVQSEQEYDRAHQEGWRDSPTEAVAYFNALHDDMARAAAEANYKAARMSEKAQAEWNAAVDATDKQVVDVIPKRKRGRPAKGTKPVTSGPEAA